MDYRRISILHSSISSPAIVSFNYSSYFDRNIVENQITGAKVGTLL